MFLNESFKDIPWKMVLTVFVTILFFRTVVVTTTTYPINMKRTRTKIGLNSQIMMIYANMRGSMSYSLIPQSGNRHSVWRLREMSRRVTMWIIVIIIGSTTYDMLHLLDIPLNCVYDTGAQSTKKRSIMATDGSPAA